MSRPSPVLPHALSIPAFQHFAKKRVVLASASPRRKDILETAGLNPEIIPSTFKEDLAKGGYSHAWAEYPVATAGEKALEVYERLVRENDRDAPDLVISADTVIIFPPQRSPDHRGPHQLDVEVGDMSRILEKPMDKSEQLKMLQDMNGKVCEVVTGVVIVYPVLNAPGFKLQSISISTMVEFHDNSDEILEAYVANGEGHDRAGGFAVQGLGGLLVKSIDGDYSNVVGFPSTAFWRWVGDLVEDGSFDD